MNVLSLFDGISCGQLALGRAGIKYEHYFASEIKPTAIKVTQHHFPNTIQLGDVRGIDPLKLDKIDLLIGGSPCKGVSLLNQNNEGLTHKESILFFEYVRILEQLKLKNPNIKFILENTKGDLKTIDKITKSLNCPKYTINSSLFSIQNRIRHYWTNIIITSEPEDKGPTTESCIGLERKEITKGRLDWLNSESGRRSISKGYVKINAFPKYACITAGGHRSWNENYICQGGKYYHLSRTELEMCQTLPIGYTNILDYGSAYDVIGDGWTVDVISFILSFLNKKTLFDDLL